MASNEALKKYGRHLSNCLGGLSDSKRPCTCGLDAALAEQSASRPAEQEPWFDREILPCPFCGGKAELVFLDIGDKYVTCDNNECHVSPCGELSKSEDVAIDLWNKRPFNNTARNHVINNAPNGFFVGGESHNTPTGTCIDCGKTLYAGSIHTCSPQVGKAPIDERDAFNEWFNTNKNLLFHHGIRVTADLAWQAAMQVRQVPDGYKIVPIEPTQEMLQAAIDTKPRRIMGKVKGMYARAEYKAMLTAAPLPPNHTEVKNEK